MEEPPTSVRAERMDCVEQQTLTKQSLRPISMFDHFCHNTGALPGGAQTEEAEMWGGIIGLIIQLISGAVGGNIAGAAMKQYITSEQSATRSPV